METENTTPAEVIDIAKERELVINYLSFRRTLGFLGISLPVLLILGSMVFNGGQIESSISNYFYTSLRDVFVVILCIMAVFLITYKGHDSKDRIITNIAGVLALITAFSPTSLKPDIFPQKYGVVLTHDPFKVLPMESVEKIVVGQQSIPTPYKIVPAEHFELIGQVHLICAALFFLTLGYLSFTQFAQTKSTRKAKKRWFRACGIIIFVTIGALVPAMFDQYEGFYTKYKIIFIGETICLWAFGFSWLLKGQLLLKDAYMERIEAR